MKKLPTKEREEIMEIRTTWEEEGLQQGLQLGKVELLIILLKEKVGKVNKNVRQQINKLSTEQLTEFGKALLNFKSEKDVESWLKKTAE